MKKLNYTFVRAVDRSRNMVLDYGFVLKITSFFELMNYWSDYRGSICEKGLSDFFESDYYFELVGRNGAGKHIKTGYGVWVANLCDCEANKNKPRKSIIDVVVDGEDKVFNGMNKALGDFGCIYVQKTGSYFFGDNIEESDEVVRDKCIFPYEKTEEAISIFKWPGGKHFYAKVNGFDVVVDDKQKWNTESAAKKAAEKFMKENE